MPRFKHLLPAVMGIGIFAGSFLIWSCIQSPASSNTATDDSTGVIWSVHSVGGGNSLNSVIWTGSQLVGLGSRGANGATCIIMTSPDGITWTLRYSDSLKYLGSVVSTGSLLVAVGSATNEDFTQSRNYVVTSPNGIDWTVRDPGITAPGSATAMQSITWTGSQFVAAADTDYVDSQAFGHDIAEFLTSPDGVNWTTQSFRTATNNSTPRSILWANNRLVAVGGSFPAVVWTSPDGVTWTARNVGTTTEALSSVAWTGSQFVAFGFHGTLATSPEGLSWTVRKAVKVAYNISSLTWTGRQLVAVGSDTNEAALILTSPDGVNWIRQTAGTMNPLGSVTWTGTKLVVVGGGTVLTSP